MKIENIAIYHYGKWQDVTFDVASHLTVFSGENEAGKSTLQTFIKQILFGFPRTRKNAIYAPKTTGSFGGKLVVTHPKYERVVIERIRHDKGSSTGNVVITTLDGRELPETVLSELVHHINQETYDRFFAFSLSDLNHLTSVDKEELNRYFLTIGQSGSDTLFQLHDQWIKKSQLLFKRSGTVPEINKKLDALLTMSHKLKGLESVQQSYFDVSKQYQEQIERKQALLSEVGVLRQQLHDIEQDVMQYAVFLEYKGLAATLSQNVPKLTQKDIDDYEQVQLNLSQLTNTIAMLEERQHHTAKKTSESFVWYTENLENIKTVVKQLPQIERMLQKLLVLDYELTSVEDSIAHEYRRLNIPQQTALPDESIVNTPDFDALYQQEQVLNTTMIDDTALREKVIVQTEKVGLYEKELDRLKQVGQNISKYQVNTVSIIGIVVALGIMFFGVASQQWLVSILALLVGSGVGLHDFLLNKKRYTNERAKCLQDMKMHYARVQKETDVLKEYQQSLSALQSRMADVNGQKTQFENMVAQWKVDNGVPESLQLEQLQDGTLEYIRDSLQKQEELKIEIASHQADVEEQIRLFDFYTEHVGTVVTDDTVGTLRQTVTSFKGFVDDMRVEEAVFYQEQEHRTHLQRDLEGTSQRYDVYVAQKQTLFDKVSANHEDVFLRAVAQFKEYEHGRQRQQLLQEQLTPYMTRLEQYESLEAVELKKETIVQQLRMQEELLQESVEKEAHLRQQKELLEQDGSYTQVQQEYSVLESDVKASVVEFGGLLVSAKIVEMLLQSGKQTHLDSVIEDTQTLFAQVTEYRYPKVIFHKQTLRVQRDDQQVFELESLSTGTLEQLYVCIRLAFIKNIQQTVQMPIMIDDCFVNFDEKRRLRMYDILEEFAKTHQILYFTFNEIKVFEQAKIHRLTKGVKTSG